MQCYDGTDSPILSINCVDKQFALRQRNKLRLAAKYMQIFKSKHHDIISDSPFSKYLQCYPENSTYKSFLCDQ